MLGGCPLRPAIAYRGHSGTLGSEMLARQKQKKPGLLGKQARFHSHGQEINAVGNRGQEFDLGRTEQTLADSCCEHLNNPHYHHRRKDQQPPKANLLTGKPL
jgi:hypothetical protein